MSESADAFGAHATVAGMSASGPSATAAILRRAAVAGLALTAASFAAMPAALALDTTLKATYVIAVGGVVVGHANAESRFSGDGYAAAIKGSTSGLTRIVSDANAKLAGSGRIVGSRIYPASYSLKTMENGLASQVQMTAQSGAIINLLASPQLPKAADRIPLTASHKTGVVDPLSAFLVPLDRPGTPSGVRACNRTVKVFDGWTRFDIALSYKETKAVDGSSQNYAGRIIVCAARYIPVAGHRSERAAIRSMANNRRLEVWLAQVENVPVLVPYRIMIGTSMGDLVILATQFTTEQKPLRAAAKQPL